MDNSELEKWIEKLEKKIDALTIECAKIAGQGSLIPVIIKFIIFPLIIVLGGKIGADYLMTM